MQCASCVTWPVLVIVHCHAPTRNDYLASMTFARNDCVNRMARGIASAFSLVFASSAWILFKLSVLIEWSVTRELAVSVHIVRMDDASWMRVARLWLIGVFE